MKKNLLFVFICLCLFCLLPKVNAAVNFLEASGCKSTLYDGRLSGIECNVKFRVSETDSNYNRVTLRITMPSDYKITSTTVEAGQGWTIVSKNDATHTYTLESKQTSFVPGTYQLFKIVTKGSSNSNNCDSILKVVPEIISRSCTIYNGSYYDKEGNITTELEYEKECKKHTCEILSDGTKYGKDGKIVTDIEYEKECKKHTCEVLSDGTKYGKDGKVVTDIEYEKECKKHTCEVLSDGTKYGKDGKVVTDIEYEKECKKHTCEVLSDGTKYGKDGKVVTDAEYEKECKEHTCEVLSDGTKYGKDGKVVTDIEYEKECKKHTCEVLSDGTKYGKDGKVVDDNTYKAECEEKKPTCEYKDHQYYNDKGEVTTKEEYEKKCKKHYCEEIDGTYFDKNGNEVNKSTFEASCKRITCAVVNGKYYDAKGNNVSKSDYEASCIQKPVDNPPTGAETPYIFLFGGLLGAGVILFNTKKKNNRFYSIK